MPFGLYVFFGPDLNSRLSDWNPSLLFPQFSGRDGGIRFSLAFCGVRIRLTCPVGQAPFIWKGLNLRSVLYFKKKKRHEIIWVSVCNMGLCTSVFASISYVLVVTQKGWEMAEEVSQHGEEQHVFGNYNYRWDDQGQGSNVMKSVMKVAAEILMSWRPLFIPSFKDVLAMNHELHGMILDRFDG